MKIKLSLYISLIRDYLNNRIFVKCFKYICFKLFKEETGEMSSEEYSILNGSFMNVEEFCDDSELREKNDIDENELKQRCRIDLQKLKEI